MFTPAQLIVYTKQITVDVTVPQRRLLCSRARSRFRANQNPPLIGSVQQRTVNDDVVSVLFCSQTM